MTKDTGRMSRVLILIMCCVQIFAKIVPPILTIRALKPTGIWISISDEHGLTKYEFEGSVNEKVDYEHPGKFRWLLSKGDDGKWSYRDNETTLHLGDVLYYRYHYVKNKEGVHGRTYTFAIEDILEPSFLVKDRPVTDCQSTVTEVRNMKVCAGQIIFEDNFDSLREDLWILEQYIAGEPEFAFVSYQHPQISQTISVHDGYLNIEPRLLQSLPSYTSLSILTGNLDLYNGCTSTASNCVRQARGANILPPIVSGRMTTKSFAFTYGTIDVRAKLPQGDWLYPDLLLQSIYERYGTSNHDSGLLRIAGARGNLELKGGDTEYGNKVLYGGARLNRGCYNNLINRTVGKEAWGNEFHIYTLRWTPDTISLCVDGVEWSRLEPSANGLLEMFPKECQPSSSMLAGAKIAPFNEPFGITLGVAAGGILEFDDNLDSNGISKPWRNADHKNIFNFWQDLTSWLPTWKQASLIVDYVKVRAL